MNDQANKILIEMLKKASDGIDAAVSFSQAQIPDVVHQLLVWNAVSSVLFQLVAIVFVFVYVTTGVRCLKGLETRKWSDAAEGLSIIWLIVGGLASVILFFAFIFNFDWLKIWLAPKLYLLEYAASLVK